jgi:uncharacterized membrane protein
MKCDVFFCVWVVGMFLLVLALSDSFERFMAIFSLMVSSYFMGMRNMVSKDGE